MSFAIKLGDRVRVKGDPLQQVFRVVGLGLHPRNVVICVAAHGTSAYAPDQLALHDEAEPKS